MAPRRPSLLLTAPERSAPCTKTGRQFRRVNGHLHLPKLRAALDAHFTGNVTAVSENEDQDAAW